MTNKTLVRTLNVGAAIGLTVGGATAIPGCPLAPSVLFYGLLFAGICKAAASELVQVKGESDEAQGITPAQVAGVQAVHDAAKAVPAVITKTGALILLTLGLAMSASAANPWNVKFDNTYEQTVTNPIALPLPAAGTTMGTLLSDILGAAKDMQPYTSNGVSIETFAMYNGSDKQGKFGGGFDLQVPVASQASIGFAAGYLNQHLLDANISAKVGTTVNWITNIPYIGTAIGPIYTWASSGPGWDFHVHKVMAYNAAGFEKTWHISKTVELSAGGGPGNISTLPGTTWFGGVKLTKNAKP